MHQGGLILHNISCKPVMIIIIMKSPCAETQKNEFLPYLKRSVELLHFTELESNLESHKVISYHVINQIEN